MFLENQGWNSKVLPRPHFVRLQEFKILAHVRRRNRARNKNRICEWPAIFPRVELRDLRIDGFHVPAPGQLDERASENLNAGIIAKVASNRARIIVAVEESFDPHDLRRALR